MPLLHYYIDPALEIRGFTAQCIEADIVSQGSTEEGAVASLQAALSLYFSEMEDAQDMVRLVKTTATVCALEDGRFVVNHGGEWVNGAFESKRAAMVAANVYPPDDITELWHRKLDNIREAVITERDINALGTRYFETFEPTETRLSIEFDCVEQANAFKSWLCNSGEQQFWKHCEIHMDDPLIPYHTDYHGDPNTVLFSAEPVKE